MKPYALVVSLAGLFCGSAPPASADAVTAHWDSYFYAAPRDTARVLDEVEDKARLDVQSCENGWCRVHYGEADGKVREFVVHGRENAGHPARHVANASCFKAAQPSGAAWQPEHFCLIRPHESGPPFGMAFEPGGRIDVEEATQA